MTATYFDNADLTGASVTRVEPTIDWSFGGGDSPDPMIEGDTFSGRWIGKLQPSVSGPHTFHVRYNDGVRLFLDERVVLYRWGPHTTTDESVTVDLVAGRKYDLRLEFYDQTGAASVRLAWETPCQARKVIPPAHFHPEAPASPACPAMVAAGAGTGLESEYFADAELTVPAGTGSDRQIDVDWGAGAPMPSAGFPADGFSVRWQGRLQAPMTGPLTIYFRADDVARIWLDGRRIADSWSEPFGGQEIAATVDVVAGQLLDLRIELRDRSGTASARLAWSWPCQPRQVVPANRLYLPATP